MHGGNFSWMHPTTAKDIFNQKQISQVNKTIAHLQFKVSRGAAAVTNMNTKSQFGVYTNSTNQLEFYWIVICAVVTKLWKTSCVLVHQQTEVEKTQTELANSLEATALLTL